VRVVKEKHNSQNATGGPPAGVQTNLPKPNNSASDTKQSTEATDKREELTNYEISSKSVATTSEGFVVNALSVAVLINRAALTASLGDKPSPEAIDKQLKEIEQLVVSAGGLRKDRGDSVKVSVVDFVDSGHDLEPVTGPSFVELLERQTGAIIGAVAALSVAALLIAFGVRPLTKVLLAPPVEVAALEAPDDFPQMQAALGGGYSTSGLDDNLLTSSDDSNDPLIQSLAEKRDKGPRRQLQKLVDFDEEHAASILRQWVRQGASG